jgi:hypothetical protein
VRGKGAKLGEGKGAKLGEGDPEHKNPETNSGFLRLGLLRSGFLRSAVYFVLDTPEKWHRKNYNLDIKLECFPLSYTCTMTL